MTTVQDLTHTFRPGFPVVGYESPHRAAVARLDTDGFRGNAWSLIEHSGTHVDAPSHFAPDGRDVSELRPEDLVVPIAVIDIADRVAADPDSAVIVADLLRHEREHGPLPDGAAVFMHSSWDARAGDAEAFHGIVPGGGRRSPGFAPETVDWLIEHRNIACIGVDSPSIDVGSATDFPVHRRWLGAARYAVEGLARLSSIPPAGAVGFVGVVPFEAGTGGPCRVLATW
ncbi:cyclase family protein [Nonomuraea deserti]|uniref:cyclase family protein n=1 Tax=Nonomuraea deserti TaxID=1848322 RepID=UPI001404C51D|nr:cyclase family protein [Nonomuraea deserti]